MILRQFLAASLLWAVGITSALALDLDAAKAKGLVGETPDGYIASVSTAPPTEVLNLIADINSKRKQMYAEIAKRNKADIRSVEALAGAKAIQKATSGEYVFLDGKWMKR